MTSKLKNIALVISIAVNLLIMGAVIGFVINKDNSRRGVPHFGSIIRHLEPDRRRELEPLIATDLKQSKRLFMQLRKNQRQLRNTLLSEPFDEAAARQAFNEVQTSSDAVQLQMHEQMITLMKNLSLEERKQVLEQVRRQSPEARSERDARRERRPEVKPPTG